MNKNDLIIGVHGAHLDSGGSRYNVLASCTKSLLQAFRNNGVRAYSVVECIERNLPISLTIGFNGSGYNSWNDILSHNIPNLMWNVDSIFYQNTEAIDAFGDNPNFVLLTITPCDKEPLACYYTGLQNVYTPGAIDLDFWKKQDCEKNIDIVYFSSIFDYEQKLSDLKKAVTSDVYDLIIDVYDLALAYPNVSFWNIIQTIKENYGIEFDKALYTSLFRELIYIVDYARRVKLVQSLSKFNLKLYGGPVWQKYISGNIELMGEVSYQESTEIMNRSKMVLHSQPRQLCQGINERVLNASALESFVIASDIESLRTSFGDNLGYYNNVTFEDVASQVDYFLNHEDERLIKAKNARKIVEENHTMTHRAAEILDLIGVDKAVV